MKRVLLVLIGLAGLYFAGRTLYRALASAETKIRWTLEGGVAGFNEQELDACLAPLAPAFFDETTGIVRDEVREGLVILFLQKLQGDVPYRLELTRDELSIEVAAEGDAATVELLLRFHEPHARAEQLAWEVRVTGRMVRQEPGWRLASTTHETVSGRRIR